MPALDANLGTNSLDTASNTITLTTSAAAVAGSRILLAVHCAASAGVVAQSCSGGSLTWDLLTTAPISGTMKVAWFSAYAPSGLASSTVLTVTFSANVNGNKGIMAASFTGCSAAAYPNYVDNLNFSTAAGATTWTCDCVTNNTNDLVFGVSVIDTSTSPTNTPSSGTEVHEFFGAGNRAYVTEYATPATATTQTISGTWASLTGASNKVTSLVAIKSIPFTFVQGAGFATNTGAFGSNVKANSLLIVGQDIDNSVTDATPTDTRGTVYTAIRSTVTSGSQRIKWWWGIAPSAGANTVTCVSGAFNGITIAEFQNNPGGTVSVDSESTSAIASGASWSSASLTATQNDSLEVGYSGSDNGATGTIGATSPTLLAGQGAISGSAGDGQGIVYEYVNAGAQTLAWTCSGSMHGQSHVAIFEIVTVTVPADTLRTFEPIPFMSNQRI